MVLHVEPVDFFCMEVAIDIDGLSVSFRPRVLGFDS